MGCGASTTNGGGSGGGTTPLIPVEPNKPKPVEPDKPKPVEPDKPKPVKPDKPEPAEPVEAGKKWHEVDVPYPLVTRKSAHALTPDEVSRIVAAWQKLTENDNDVPGSSQYFRLGVIHGGAAWRSSLLTEMPNPPPSFCVHGPECFPNWHRICTRVALLVEAPRRPVPRARKHDMYMCMYMYMSCTCTCTCTCAQPRA